MTSDNPQNLYSVRCLFHPFWGVFRYISILKRTYQLEFSFKVLILETSENLLDVSFYPLLRRFLFLLGSVLLQHLYINCTSFTEFCNSLALSMKDKLETVKMFEEKERRKCRKFKKSKFHFFWSLLSIAYNITGQLFCCCFSMHFMSPMQSIWRQCYSRQYRTVFHCSFSKSNFLLNYAERHIPLGISHRDNSPNSMPTTIRILLLRRHSHYPDTPIRHKIPKHVHVRM